MPVDILTSVFFDGVESIPGWEYIKRFALPALGAAGVKYYLGGTTNTWDRDLHGKVFMITGGTSGTGQQLALELATKGAQIILLVRSTEDLWTVDYVEDLRETSNNHLIYAEQCDLADLHLVRKFATKWLDNQPPRRLDGVICCAAESTPIGVARQFTIDGVERQMGINYLAHFHLLTLLGPSLRVQPPDRDVRVILCSCSTHALGEVDTTDLLWTDKTYPLRQPWKVYGTSKLLLGLFAKEYQRQLDKYERPDKSPVNVRINLVNPGIMRSPSTRRFLSMGSIFGLILYVLMWPLWWFVLKSTGQGIQSILFALYAPVFKKVEGGNYIQECKIVAAGQRKEYLDEQIQEEVFIKTQELLADLEKKAAIERKKKERLEEMGKSTKQKKEEEKQREEKKKTAQQHRVEKLRLELGIGRSTATNVGGSELPLFPQKITEINETR